MSARLRPYLLVCQVRISLRIAFHCSGTNKLQLILYCQPQPFCRCAISSLLVDDVKCRNSIVPRWTVFTFEIRFRVVLSSCEVDSSNVRSPYLSLFGTYWGPHRSVPRARHGRQRGSIRSEILRSLICTQFVKQSLKYTFVELVGLTLTELPSDCFVPM